MADFVEQHDVVHDRMQIFIDEDVSVSLNHHVRAFLAGEVAGHYDQPQLVCDSVCIPCPALAHDPVCFLDSFICSNKHGNTPFG